MKAQLKWIAACATPVVIVLASASCGGSKGDCVLRFTDGTSSVVGLNVEEDVCTEACTVALTNLLVSSCMLEPFVATPTEPW